MKSGSLLILGICVSFYTLAFSFQAVWNQRRSIRAEITCIRAAAIEVEEREVIKLFSRLADDYLLLDIPGAGTPGMMNCCHGGCDNCAYSHVFDNLSAGRPKWVPVYATRQLIDGRSHTSPWGRLFRDDPHSTEPFDDLHTEPSRRLSWAELQARIQALPSRGCLGTPTNAPPDEMLDESVLQLLRLAVERRSDRVTDSGDGLDSDTVSVQEFSAALARVTKEEHGAPWRSFCDGFKRLAADHALAGN